LCQQQSIKIQQFTCILLEMTQNEAAEVARTCSREEKNFHHEVHKFAHYDNNVALTGRQLVVLI
jgi:hypothetical protein